MAYSTGMGMNTQATPTSFTGAAMSGGTGWGGSQWQMPASLSPTGGPNLKPTLGSPSVVPSSPQQNFQTSGMLYGQLGPNGQPDFSPAHTVANTMWQGAPNSQIAQNVGNASGSQIMGAYLPGEEAFLQADTSAPYGSWANPQWRASVDQKVMAVNQANPYWQSIYGGYQPPTLGGSSSGIANPAYKGPMASGPSNPMPSGGTLNGSNSVGTNAPVPTQGFFGQPITNPAVQGGLQSAQQGLTTPQQMLQLLSAIAGLRSWAQPQQNFYGGSSGGQNPFSQLSPNSLAMMLGMQPQQGPQALGNGGMGFFGSQYYPSMP